MNFTFILYFIFIFKSSLELFMGVFCLQNVRFAFFCAHFFTSTFCVVIYCRILCSTFCSQLLTKIRLAIWIAFAFRRIWCWYVCWFIYMFFLAPRQVGKYFHWVHFCSSFLMVRFARGIKTSLGFIIIICLLLVVRLIPECLSKHKQFVLFVHPHFHLSVSRPETVACRLMQIKQFKEINKKVVYKFEVKRAMRQAPKETHTHECTWCLVVSHITRSYAALPAPSDCGRQ